MDDSGTLWVATWAGLQLFHRDSGRFTTFRHDPGDPRSLSNDELNAVYEDRSGALWAGTWHGGVNRLGRGVKFRHYFVDPVDPNSLSNNAVKRFHEDETGDIWVGTASGLNRFDPQTGRVTRYLNDPEDPSSLSHDEIWSIGEDSKRKRCGWGTVGGLNRYHRANDTFTRVDLEPPPDATRPDAVAAVHEDRAGTLWAGTAAGLVEIRSDGTKIRHLHDPDDPVSLSHSFCVEPPRGRKR